MEKRRALSAAAGTGGGPEQYGWQLLVLATARSKRLSPFRHGEKARREIRDDWWGRPDRFESKLHHGLQVEPSGTRLTAPRGPNLSPKGPPGRSRIYAAIIAESFGLLAHGQASSPARPARDR